MRAAVVLVWLVACSGSDRPTATSGPIESIVHVGPTSAQLLAVHHRLELDQLPIDAPLGLPLTGTIELDAVVTIPLSLLRPDVANTSGRAAVRCVGRCRLGDDRTRLRTGLGDVEFSHLDLDGLEAEVEVRAGVVRITRWALASPDLEATVGLEVRLARAPTASVLDGCVRFRPTAALAARDPGLQTVVALAASADADGWRRLRIAGTVGAPRLIATACEPATAPR
ncbi:MAG: hypothetical protein IPL61_31515 [Myxococcales bacterium]|nr:hypothetical protein [Myxococcales bacterium]